MKEKVGKLYKLKGCFHLILLQNVVKHCSLLLLINIVKKSQLQSVSVVTGSLEEKLPEVIVMFHD